MCVCVTYAMCAQDGGNTGITDTYSHAQVYVGSGNLNSGLSHVHGRHFPNASFPQSTYNVFKATSGSMKSMSLSLYKDYFTIMLLILMPHVWVITSGKGFLDVCNT